MAHVHARERAGSTSSAVHARARQAMRVGNTRGASEGDARRRRGSPRLRRGFRQDTSSVGQRGVPVPKGASRRPARRARRRDADRDHPHPARRGDARRAGMCVRDARRRERGREPNRVSQTSDVSDAFVVYSLFTVSPSPRRSRNEKKTSKSRALAGLYISTRQEGTKHVSGITHRRKITSLEPSEVSRPPRPRPSARRFRPRTPARASISATSTAARWRRRRRRRCARLLRSSSPWRRR